MSDSLRGDLVSADSSDTRKADPLVSAKVPSDAQCMDLDELVRISTVRRDAASGAAREARKDARVSQPELAEVVGIPVSTLSRWEKGLQAPRGPAALRYADALDRLSGLCHESDLSR